MYRSAPACLDYFQFLKGSLLPLILSTFFPVLGMHSPSKYNTFFGDHIKFYFLFESSPYVSITSEKSPHLQTI